MNKLHAIRFATLALSIPLSFFAFLGNAPTAWAFDKEKVEQLLLFPDTSVMDKKNFVENVDPHDYISYGRYWWPNPNTPNGLPYIKKDGVANTALIEQGDAGRFSKTSDAIYTLAQAFKSSQDPRYAQKAAQLLKTWFLDPKTAMNPNLDHGQMVLGANTGKSSGLIEMRFIYNILEAEPLLAQSPFWTAEDDQQFRQWFERYFQWLTTSPIGREGSGKPNNHGTWYDVQATSIALFLGKTDWAKTVFEAAKSKRIAAQIEPDGKQPAELARTRALTYTLFNLEAFFALATLSDRAGVDLWHYQTPDGRGILKAWAFAQQYQNGKSWPYSQINALEPWRWPLLEKAAESGKLQKVK
jgi:hypothetical protein